VNLFAATINSSSAAAGGGAYFSSNNGMSWTDVGLGNTIVNWLAVNSTYLFVMTYGEGPANSVASQKANHFERTQIISSGWSSGVWRRPISDLVTSVQQTPNAFPNQFTLSQNYPNPFNPSTTIRYALPSPSRVHLMVYNVLGQIVADLLHAEQTAGWNEIVWNANVASGLYFYRMEAVSLGDPSKRFVEVKKMVLLK
jgi:hypothetical protein